jgi:hypothetical protein
VLSSPPATLREALAHLGFAAGQPIKGAMLGIPCLVATQADLEWLQKAIGREPQTPPCNDAA